MDRIQGRMDRLQNMLMIILNNQMNPHNSIHQQLPPQIHPPRFSGKFQIICELGKGQFGQVFKAIDQDSGQVYALKRINKNKIKVQNLLSQFIRELKINSYTSHENILPIYCFLADEQYFYIVMELATGGDLFGLLQRKKSFSQQATSFICRSVLQRINYLHGINIFHRDIKPENIVLSMGHIKICDFTQAVNKTHPYEERRTYCGSPVYFSPEMLERRPYNEKIDVWAIGILAYELFFGVLPFDIGETAQLSRIITDEIRFPPHSPCSKDFKQFIAELFTKDPNDRVASAEALKLPFIRKFSDLETCQQLCI